MAKRKLLTITACFMLLTLLSGCAVTNKFGPYMGKVIDAETEQPIEGAVVFMKCGSLTGNLGGSQYHYIDAKEVLTDSKGEFNIELRVNTLRPGHVWEYPKFIIFKAGYGVFPKYQGSSVDITTRNTSSFFPEDKFVTIKLPQLKSAIEKKKNLFIIDEYDNNEIPFEKRKNLHRMVSKESVAAGYKPLPVPKH